METYQLQTLKIKEGLSLNPIKVNADYLEKWNATHYTDFICLTYNGELLRNTLYRIGGINNPNPKTDKYIMLLKYVEAYYDDDITTDKDSKPHLKGNWCILDSHGNEKVEIENSLDYPYLIKNSVVYQINNHYYNIETGELYCKAFNKVESKDYLFLENAYDKDKSKRGVMQINKHTGKWELFPL